MVARSVAKKGAFENTAASVSLGEKQPFAASASCHEKCSQSGTSEKFIAPKLPGVCYVDYDVHSVHTSKGELRPGF